MIGWIYDLGNEKINGQMRLNMFTLLKTFQQKAADSYFWKYRSLYKDVHPVGILDYTSDVNFREEEKEMSKIEQFYAEQQKQELSEVKNITAYMHFLPKTVHSIFKLVYKKWGLHIQSPSFILLY